MIKQQDVKMECTCKLESSEVVDPLGKGLGPRLGRRPLCLCLCSEFNLKRCEGCFGGRSGEGEGVERREGQDPLCDLISVGETWRIKFKLVRDVSSKRIRYSRDK